MFKSIIAISLLSATSAFAGLTTPSILGGNSGTNSGGVITNVYPYGIVTDTNALAFANQNNISDSSARNDLISFDTVLSQAGCLTNLVDAVFLNPRFNPTNNKTFYGRTITPTAITYTRWGALFNGTSSIMTVAGLPDLKTNNSVVTVWRTGITNVSQGAQGGSGTYSQWISGLINPANSSSDYLYWAVNQLKPGLHETTGDVVPSTLPFSEVNYDVNGASTWCNARTVSILSYQNNTNQSLWLNGFQEGILNNTTFTNGSTVTIANSLTQLQLGYGAAPVTFNGFFNGEIAVCLVFNTAITTNQAAAIQLAVRFLEPDTTDRIFIGDSLYAAVVTNSSIPISFQTNSSHANENCWWNFAQSGTKLGSYAPASGAFVPLMTNYIMTAFPQCSKVTKRELYLEGGVNDFYTGDIQSAIWLYLTNTANFWQTNGWTVYVSDVSGISTNATSPYTYNGTTEASIAAYDLQLATNQNRFAGLFKRSVFSTQWLLNVTNAYSNDGLHYNNLTNGYLANLAIADIMLGLNPETTTTVISKSGVMMPTYAGGTYQQQITGGLNTDTLTIGNATNTATGTLLQTNFISGKLYTNIYGRPISISANATLTTTGVSGNSSLSLLASGYLTNAFAMSTIVTSIAMSYTNVISMVIPASQTYTFTNTSAGAGDSSSVVGGQILVQ